MIGPLELNAKELATLSIAAAGLLLGLRSEWRAWRGEKVQVKVTPKLAYPVGPMPSTETRVAIEVVNFGKFPITIDEVGFTVRGERARFAITVPIVVDGKPWPRRLDPHDSVIVYANIDERFNHVVKRVQHAYAATATGVTVRGTSNALKALVRLGEPPPFRAKRSVTGLPGYVNVAEVYE